MARDVIPGGQAALQKALATCVSDFKACPDPESAVSVLKLGEVLPVTRESMFLGGAHFPNLYLRGEVLKTLAFASAVLDTQVAAMSSESMDDCGASDRLSDANMMLNCHPSPVNDFLSCFHDLELPALKEHLENYAAAFRKVTSPRFHSYLHGFPETGKSVLLNWLAIFAGLNGNPIFCFEQAAKTLTVYHPDGSIAAVRLFYRRGDVDQDLNRIIKGMFYSQKWDKTPIVLWNTCVSEQGPLPDCKDWGPSFVAPNTHTIPDSSDTAYYHNILPWSEKETVNLFSLTHSRSDVSRMYHFTGGAIAYFHNGLLAKPQFTAAMESRMRESEDPRAMRHGRRSSFDLAAEAAAAVPDFRIITEKMETLLVEKKLMDDDLEADLQLLRVYVPADAAAVPSSAYEIMIEVAERVRRSARQHTDNNIDADIDDIVQSMIFTMSEDELRVRYNEWRMTMDFVLQNRSGDVSKMFCTSTRSADGFWQARNYSVNEPRYGVVCYVVPRDKYEFMHKCVPGHGIGSVRFTSPYIESEAAKYATNHDGLEFARFMKTGYNHYTMEQY
jgi:hypothetical protein